MKNFCLGIFIVSTIAFSSAHWDSAYFRNSDDGFQDKSKWMAGIPKYVRLNQMAIPGTHESHAAGTWDSDSVYTQILSIVEQLKAGIRFFDVAVTLSGEDAFRITPNGRDFGSFCDFLRDVTVFLESNPSETVLIKLTKYGDQDYTKYDEALQKYMKNEKCVLKEGSHLKTTNAQVTLGEARGKFLFFINYRELGFEGISWRDASIQDDYYMKTNWDLYYRWTLIKDHLYKAKNGSTKQFYVNFLSGHGGSFPYFVASGHTSPGTSTARLATGETSPIWTNWEDFPRTDCLGDLCTIAFEGTNILTRDYIKKFNDNVDQTRTVGIIAADFPGQGLINEIIRNNWIFTKD